MVIDLACPYTATLTCVNPQGLIIVLTAVRLGYTTLQYHIITISSLNTTVIRLLI